MTSKSAIYALDLSNDSVSLWHCPPHKSWRLLGKVALAAEDFSAEIEALKKSHKPDDRGSFMVCVRIPSSEVYASEIDLGGATAANVTEKTKAFLIENTPYKAQELVFDLESPDGSNTSFVAAITKTTITEAKKFIAGYGFEALYYTSKLDRSDFPRDPRFYDDDKPAITAKPAAQSPVTASQIKTQTLPDTGDITVPPPPAMRIKPDRAPQNTNAAKPPQTPLTAPVTATKTDFSDFSTIRSKTLIADKPNGKADPAISNRTPPAPRISIAEPVIIPDLDPDLQSTIDTPGKPEPVSNQIKAPLVNAAPIKMPQGEAAKPTVRGFFKLRYILALTTLLLIALLYWFYITLFDGKEEIARLQTPLNLSEPQIAATPPALKHKISKDLQPAQLPNEIAYINQIPALKKTDLAVEPAPVVVAGDTPKVASVFKKPGLPPNILDTAPAAPKQAETTLTETTKAVESPVIPSTQNDNAVVAALPATSDSNVITQPAGTQVPTENRTTVPEGVTLSETTPETRTETAVAPDLADAPDLLALADPTLKAIQPRFRPVSIAELAKADRNSLLARADPTLAGIKPKPRPDNLFVPANLATAPLDIKVTVQTATSDTIRPHRRPKSLGTIVVASIKAENGQIASLGTSVAVKSSPVNIQKEATERARFSKRRISLVGVYGTASKRRALVRLPSGRYVKVEIGQKFSGWKVSAIGESSVRITKGSRNQVLRMPK